MPHWDVDTTIVTDAYSRFRRLCGDEVRFQTGTDEHGEKIAEAVASRRDPRVRRPVRRRLPMVTRRTWPWNRTTSSAPPTRTTWPRCSASSNWHRPRRHLLQRVPGGLYCRGCERFLTEKELVDGKAWTTWWKLLLISEQNHFFHEPPTDWLIDHIKTHLEFITPERYRNEVLSFLSEPLEDQHQPATLAAHLGHPATGRQVRHLCLVRRNINYLTASATRTRPTSPVTGRSRTRHRQGHPQAEHAIYWPTMLRAMGLEPFQRLQCARLLERGRHQDVEIVGNDPPKNWWTPTGWTRCATVPRDELRLDLVLREAILARHNADLANDLGNLFPRLLTMIDKAAGRVPEVVTAGFADPADWSCARPQGPCSTTSSPGHGLLRPAKALQAWRSACLHRHQRPRQPVKDEGRRYLPAGKRACRRGGCGGSRCSAR